MKKQALFKSSIFPGKNIEWAVILTEVSPFLKSFKFGRAISHNFSLQSTKNWHGN